MVLQYSNSVAHLNILLVDAVREGAAHEREPDIARSPSCVEIREQKCITVMRRRYSL